MKRRLLRLSILGVGVLAIAWGLLPRPDMEKPGSGWSSVVRDRHGALLHLSTAADGRYRLRTPLPDVSPQWIEATLRRRTAGSAGIPGVNPFALLRATWGSVTGRPAGGASTLTMQVARLRWRLETRTIPGKLVANFPRASNWSAIIQRTRFSKPISTSRLTAEMSRARARRPGCGADAMPRRSPGARRSR